jgi:RNA polymerase sigma-70 factor, ECF subfamily
VLNQTDHKLLRDLQSSASSDATADDAFGQLQAQLEPGVRRFVRRLIGMSDAEDDIVQDVFIALYRNIHRINPVEKLRPYLFRIARNRCYDELRRQRRFDTVSLDDEPTGLSAAASFDDLPDTESPPDEVTHLLMLHLEVQQAMERLPELQRQALILYCEENLSYNEIAEIMNTSIGTIKSRLYYAKRGLRGLLRPETLSALENEFA